MAAVHAHCHTSTGDETGFPEGSDTMVNAKIIEPWEVGAPALVPQEAAVIPASGEGLGDHFLSTVCVDDHLLARAQQDLSDQSA